MNFQQAVAGQMIFDRKKLGKYRDLALSCIGGFSLLFGWISMTEARSPNASTIDWKVSIGCFALTLVCTLLSPNRAVVFGGCFGVIAGLVLLNFFATGNLKALGVGIAMAICAGVVAIGAGVIEYYRKR